MFRTPLAASWSIAHGLLSHAANRLNNLDDIREV
jgi:hypothetical protein